MDVMKEYYSNDHASCHVGISEELPIEMQDRVREVTKVFTDPEYRQQGYATELMKTVCEEADLCNFVLILHPWPYDGNVSKDKLINWYKRFGFVKTQDKPVLMARAPEFKVRQSMVGTAVEKVIRG